VGFNHVGHEASVVGSKWRDLHHEGHGGHEARVVKFFTEGRKGHEASVVGAGRCVLVHWCDGMLVGCGLCSGGLFFEKWGEGRLTREGYGLSIGSMSKMEVCVEGNGRCNDCSVCAGARSSACRHCLAYCARGPQKRPG